ncbi:hypothetical protein CH298_02665 [Rhodococcoides fascians]|uniref:hypothetical protein n=1 Tax=Rhodococcoides fascians TaxID=1828 RepID=UPI000B9BCE20|nr:hypothetical protein [Rhodococcus fascians]OZE92455.1 hypothetical protein CH303_02665 [Rhodococcus fascians]OZF23088.1 hypothetical protein CH298_02665 [Rhodococcus fascians]OZF24802.1 hypothetical protein CH297_02665 [Rhodococcus fascians]OZF72397.1 hypothetical protein CH308_02670 [Rhodococcus fascians]OZF73695.1 hypothetical protein CH307_02665 [Rhodococcus fascians]
MARITYKMAGFRAIRKSPKVVQALKGLADDIADDCNAAANVDDGYVSKISQSASRARATVITSNAKSIRDNARNNTIIKQANKSR